MFLWWIWSQSYRTSKVSCDVLRACSEHLGGDVTAESGAGVDSGPVSYHRRWCREGVLRGSRWSTFSIQTVSLRVLRMAIIDANWLQTPTWLLCEASLKGKSNSRGSQSWYTRPLRPLHGAGYSLLPASHFCPEIPAEQDRSSVLALQRLASPQGSDWAILAQRGHLGASEHPLLLSLTLKNQRYRGNVRLWISLQEIKIS